MILRRLIHQKLSDAGVVLPGNAGVQLIDSLMQIAEPKLLSAAHHALLSYANGNASPELAAEIAASIEKAWVDHPATAPAPTDPACVPPATLKAHQVKVFGCSLCSDLHLIFLDENDRQLAHGLLSSSRAAGFAAEVIRVHHLIAVRDGRRGETVMKAARYFTVAPGARKRAAENRRRLQSEFKRRLEAEGVNSTKAAVLAIYMVKAGGKWISPEDRAGGKCAQ